MSPCQCHRIRPSAWAKASMRPKPILTRPSLSARETKRSSVIASVSGSKIFPILTGTSVVPSFSVMGPSSRQSNVETRLHTHSSARRMPQKAKDICSEPIDLLRDRGEKEGRGEADSVKLMQDMYISTISVSYEFHNDTLIGHFDLVFLDKL